VSNYKNQLIDLFMNGNEWTREHTLKAYDYLHGAFYENEVDISSSNLSDVYWGIIHLCDILNGEGSYGASGVQREIRSSLLAVMVRLNVISKDEKRKIIDRLYNDN
jgi:hypothetical protein